MATKQTSSEKQHEPAEEDRFSASRQARLDALALEVIQIRRDVLAYRNGEFLDVDAMLEEQRSEYGETGS